MFSEDDLREALRACFDSSNPFKRPLNIVDLGLVQAIHLEVDDQAPGFGIAGVPLRQRLHLSLISTSNDPDANTILVAQIENRLAGLPEISRSTVELLDSPAWSTNRVSGDLRRELRLDPSPFLILNKPVR